MKNIRLTAKRRVKGDCVDGEHRDFRCVDVFEDNTEYVVVLHFNKENWEIAYLEEK